MTDSPRGLRPRVLVADDDESSRQLIVATLRSGGYETAVVENGAEAWDLLQQSEAPQLAVLDWAMPKMQGIEVCRRLREAGTESYVYVVLLTARDGVEDIVAGLSAGADDYITKPWERQELLLRLRAGERVIRLESRLREKLMELAGAREDVEKLQGLLPVCPSCYRIRDDENLWHRIESYVEAHSRARFTHSLCRSCLKEHYPEFSDPA